MCFVYGFLFWISDTLNYVGTIYLRQERIELAEYHFKRAVAINPTSSVLQTYLGMVLNAYDRFGIVIILYQAYVSFLILFFVFRLDKNNEAIMVLRQACKYDTRNSMLFFQLAHVLLKNGSQEHLEDALVALYVVKEYAPKEPPVYCTLWEVRESFIEYMSFFHLCHFWLD